MGEDKYVCVCMCVCGGGGGVKSQWNEKRGFVYFFAYWHPTAQAGSQPDDFSYEGFEGEILLQDDTSQDGFQLWYTRTCKKQKKKQKQSKNRRDEGVKEITDPE